MVNFDEKLWIFPTCPSCKCACNQPVNADCNNPGGCGHWKHLANTVEWMGVDPKTIKYYWFGSTETEPDTPPLSSHQVNEMDTKLKSLTGKKITASLPDGTIVYGPAKLKYFPRLQKYRIGKNEINHYEIKHIFVAKNSIVVNWYD